MTFPRKARLAALVTAMAGAACVMALRCGRGVETDVNALMDTDGADALAALSSVQSSRMRLLLEGDSATAVDAAAVRLRPLVQPDAAADNGIAAAVDFLASRRDGLLAESTRTNLLQRNYAEVEKESLSLLFSGVVPPVFPLRGDPFMLGTIWFMDLAEGAVPPWSMRNGLPTMERDGHHFVLLEGTCKVDSAGVKRMLDVLERVRIFNAENGPVRAYPCGAPFHSALARTRSMREIAVLSWASILAVLSIGRVLLGSFAFVPLLLAALACGSLAGTAALFACPSRPHVLTFVFGTSLIGLGVDYVYHILAAGDEQAQVRRKILHALATTLSGFVPLFFSSVLVLRQMALFTTVGLVGVFCFLMVCAWGRRPKAAADGVPVQRARPWQRWIAAALVLFCAGGVVFLRTDNGPASFYRPPSTLLAGERLLASLGMSTGEYAVTEGGDIQEALEREEAAGLRGVSSIVPSLKRQRENALMVAEFCRQRGGDYSAKTGLKVPMPSRERLLSPQEAMENQFMSRLLSPMLAQRGGRTFLMGMETPGSRMDERSSPGVRRFNPQVELTAFFDRHANETYRLLGASVLVMAIVLVGLFRRRFPKYILPVACAISATAGLLGWCGVKMTFFHPLCFFIVVGLGVDYAIFWAGSPSRSTLRAVTASFLTSFVGLGALALTSFPVTRSMGVVFALALAFSYLFARAFSSDGSRTSPATAETAWYAQREQSASRFRLALMWWVYSHLGKRAVKALTLLVMLFVYPFARPARLALRSFYATLSAYGGKRAGTFGLFRHLLEYAWTLVDKTDACTLRRSLPRVTARDDGAWRSLRDLLDSGRGAFLVSSHLGCAEMLSALDRGAGSRRARVHAFQHLGHDTEFTRMVQRHFNVDAFVLHSTEDIGVETAVDMQDAVRRGELVLMAGDRTTPARARSNRDVCSFMGRDARWPLGVFAFADLVGAPVYFFTCVKVGRELWEVHFRQFVTDASTVAVASRSAVHAARRRMLEEYVSFLEEETLRHPSQWHHFHEFFLPPAEIS